MVTASVEERYFNSRKGELLGRHPGQFAVVCGKRLLGVHQTLEAALKAAGDAFEDGDMEEGAPILISEIAETVKVRVVAQPRRS